MPPLDNRLVHSKPQTEQQAFEALYYEHARMVRGVLFNLVGERFLDDLTQEVFVKVWKGLDQFTGQASLRTWIYRVTVNAAMDFLRRVSRMEVSGIQKARWERIEDAQANGFERNENRQAVQVALLELDEIHRAVVVLHYLEDLSLDLVAEVLEVPVGTVKSRLHSSREKLREVFLKMGINYES
jgi:RNA polymerase sigma-70 factor, ECF subfamily